MQPLKKTAIFAVYDAFKDPKEIRKPSIFYKMSISPILWGSLVKKHNQKNKQNKAYYKTNEHGEVTEAAFQEENKWWIVYKLVIPHVPVFVVDLSNTFIKF